MRGAKIFVNNRLAGLSPLSFHRVPVGKHKLKVVEHKNGKPGRSKVVSFQVSTKNTRKAPLKLTVAM